MKKARRVGTVRVKLPDGTDDYYNGTSDECLYDYAVRADGFLTVYETDLDPVKQQPVEQQWHAIVAIYPPSTWSKVSGGRIHGFVGIGDPTGIVYLGIHAVVQYRPQQEP